MEKLKYAFAYWSPREKKWLVCNTYFVLTDGFGENSIYGQFLSSSWFSYHHHLKDKLVPFHFAVLGQKNSINFEKTRRILNSHLNLVPSCNDVHSDSFDFSEYFHIGVDLIEEISSNLETDGITTTFTMRGHRKSVHRLSLNIRKFTDQGNEKISIALPQVSI
jgi:hypothetical protein